jgi:anti-sigma-K factor RskA
MSDQNKEKMLELLSDRATFGLSEEEIAELARLEKEFPELNDESFELAAASIAMVNLETEEPMPAHLRSKIAQDAENYFAARRAEASSAETSPEKEEFQKTFTLEPRKSNWLGWLGWAVAAAALIILVLNTYQTQKRIEQFGNEAKVLREEVNKALNANSTLTPKSNPIQERQQLIASAPDVVQSTWGDFDAKKQAFNIQGDVVWSNSEQKGYVRFSNLPVNDKTKEQYQVWIFDGTQKYPVDGGVFDANAAGEIVIPIDAKIKVQKPTMFAITAEKPGGVVVSPLEKVMAVAKVAA